jgi:hypothetical protein
VDGYDLLSSKPKGFKHSVNVPTQPADGLGDLWAEHAPIGTRKVTVEQTDAFFTTTADRIHTAMKDMPTTSRLLAFAPASNAIGALFVGLQGVLTTTYGVISKLNALTNADVTHLGSGQVDEGVVLQSHTTKTVDWNTKTDGAAVDYALNTTQRVIPITSATKAAASVVTTPIAHGLTTGDLILISGNTLAGPSINAELAVTVLSTTTFSVPVNTAGSSGVGTGGSFVRTNSSGGGVGYQFVSALTGFTGFVGKIRDSADDLTYADLITFANVTAAPAKERATVVGVVDRYLSYDGNVTGSGTIKPFVGFRRL